MVSLEKGAVEGGSFQDGPRVSRLESPMVGAPPTATGKTRNGSEGGVGGACFFGLESEILLSRAGSMAA